MNRSSEHVIHDKLRAEVLKRDGYMCRYCGDKSGNFWMDHVYPVSKGGETSIENLVTSCSLCNMRKHAGIGIWPKPIGYFDEHKELETYRGKSEKGIPGWVTGLFLIGLFIISLPTIFWNDIPYRLLFTSVGMLMVILSLGYELGRGKE